MFQHSNFGDLAGSTSIALNMCDHVFENHSAIDDQRSGGVAKRVTCQSTWEVAYERRGNFERERSYSDMQRFLKAHPEVELIHNANTAMAMGSIFVVQEVGSDVKVTAWGGTGDRLNHVKSNTKGGTSENWRTFSFWWLLRECSMDSCEILPECI